MVQDRPDYTDIMQIIGSDIMVPLDLQAALIMMPIDIQAQLVNLEVDIVAQKVGNIAVNIAAADIGNIGIDIKANTLGNLTIDIETQSIGVQLQPDWQTVQGKQKYFRADDQDLAPGDFAGGTFTPTGGKTLYITHFGAGTHATLAANRDKNQIMFCMIYKLVDATPIFFAEKGGNAGAGGVLPTPAKILTGEEFRYRVYNHANHNVIAYITAGGYEI